MSAPPGGIVERWVYVVRHGDAEPRGTWRGEDGDRPLTGKGVRQARALADRFDTGRPAPRRASGTGKPGVTVDPPTEARPVRLVSSVAERCIATLRPLAQVTALEIEIEDVLAEGSDAAEALGRLEGLAAAVGSGVVACSHGDVIWAMLVLLERNGVAVPKQADAKKGSIWALGLDHTRVVTARYLPPAKV